MIDEELVEFKKQRGLLEFEEAFKKIFEDDGDD